MAPRDINEQETPRCYACGKGAEKLYPTYWTAEPVCPHCVLHSDEFPEHVFGNLPTPPQVLAAIEQSPTIESVQAAFRLIEPLQGKLFPPRKEPAYGIASIGPGLYVRTSPRKKGGRRG